MQQSEICEWHHCDDDQTVITQDEENQQEEITYIPPYNIKGIVMKNIKINTTNCRGEAKLMKKLVSINGWKEVYNDGDVCWLGLPFRYINLDEYITQRVNRYPSMDIMAHKTQTSFFLNQFLKYYPDEFDFFPRTWSLPDEAEKFQNEYSKSKMYIAKPDAGSQGDGIYIVKDIKDIKVNESIVIQEYIDKPLLIDNKKFDLRLYVLISSIDPYICYINYEGLARFCTVDYEKPTKNNLRNSFMHLTNYSLNKRSNDFKHFAGNFHEINDGTKRTFSSIKKNLELLGYNVQEILHSIEELIKSFMKSIYPFIKYNNKIIFQEKWNQTKCFQILGFDILLDAEAKPWLLEVNSNPSLSIDHEIFGPNGKSVFEVSELDFYVKGLVAGDAVKIVMKNPEFQLENFQIINSYQMLNLDDDFEDSPIAKMLKIYGSLSGYKFNEKITSSKFCKLASLQGMTIDKFRKNDYDLLYRKILLKTQSIQMDFMQFIQALEALSIKLNMEEEQLVNQLTALMQI